MDRLHKPTADLGFTPLTEYRVDRLGVQGRKAGAEYIEGGVYCPGTPEPLKNASKERNDGIIDLHAKENPDEEGKQPLRCPALGDSPTVTCPLRELSRKAVDKPRPGVEKDDLPEFLDRICKQHSVSFTEDDNLHQKQTLPYQSDE